MKNRSACLIIAMLLCAFCVLNNAVSETIAMTYVNIPDKQISIAVPERFITFERNDAVLDKKLIEYGFTKSGLQEAMKQNSVYLYAFDPDLTYDINVVVTESDVVSSLDLFDDSLLLSILDGYKEMYENTGLKVIKQSIYKTSKGIKLFRVQGELTTNPNQKMLQVMAVEDNQTIVITLTIYNGVISKENERLIEMIAENSSFSKGTGKTGEITQVEDEVPNLNYYYNKEARIHFIIPQGWEERNLSQEREFLKFKMSPVDDDYATSIMFGCKDLWNMFPEATRKSWGIYSRSDMDSLLDEEMLAALAGVDTKDIKMVSYDGTTFGICDIKQDNDLGLDLKFTCALSIHDGCFIQFQMYDLKGMYINTFETILNSAYFD